MISFIVMATLSTAPEMQAGIFNRRHRTADCCQQAAPCTGCGEAAPCGTPGSPCAPAADAPAGGAPAGGEPAKQMPKGGDAPKGDMPKGDKATTPATPKAATPPKAAEAAIEIPAPLKEAINKSDQKQQILDYLANTSVPREKRIQYLETVRQTLLPGDNKK